MDNDIFLDFAEITPFEVSQSPSKAMPLGEKKFTVNAANSEMLSRTSNSLAISLIGILEEYHKYSGVSISNKFIN